MTHDELSGQIRSDGLIIDGRLVPWSTLQDLLICHVGAKVELRIRDSTDSP